jgi:TPR repeat protein
VKAETSGPHVARIQELLVTGQDAAEADQWIAAARLWIEAANLGSLDDENAGALLADRLSAEDRDEEALKWYTWAAERGHDGAANAAADWYRDGFGTPPDDTRAMRWLPALTAKLNLDAVHKAHTIGSRMTDDQIRAAGGLANLPDQAEIMVATVRSARRSG